MSTAHEDLLGPPSSKAPSRERPLVTRVFGHSDVGRRREENEDRFLIASPVSTLWTARGKTPPSMPVGEIEGELFVVADGMGGHAGGAEASALAVEAVETSIVATLGWLFSMGAEPRASVDFLGEMGAALRSADAKVCEEASRTPGKREMGTTLTMAYRYGAWLFVVHAGDSRCYLLRDDRLHRITRDHTLVGEMVRRGVIGAEEACQHELRHIVTNAVGGPVPGVRSEGHRLRLAPRDALLLCTDGLTEMVSDGEIRDLLRTIQDPEEACRELVDRANDHGGVDNVTVIVARFDSAGQRDRVN